MAIIADANLVDGMRFGLPAETVPLTLSLVVDLRPEKRKTKRKCPQRVSPRCGRSWVNEFSVSEFGRKPTD